MNQQNRWRNSKKLWEQSSVELRTCSFFMSVKYTFVLCTVYCVGVTVIVEDKFLIILNQDKTKYMQEN